MDMKTDASTALPPAPRNPAGHSPRRRPGSIRRTSTIDTTWPEGRSGLLRLVGVARDAITPLDGGAPVIQALDSIKVRMSWDRTIREIESDPPRAQIQTLVGARGGGRLRQVLHDVLPDEKQSGTPLYLLLDDLSGASLVAGWAWSRWTDAWLAPQTPASGGPAQPPRQMEGICTGFRPGSGALRPDGGSNPDQNAFEVAPLPHPDDPQGWHATEPLTGVSMRRARRIDVWVDELIRIDATFQDSASAPGGGRVAVHEYTLEATADPVSHRLLSVRAEPRILPYRECPAAADNVGRMVGTPLHDLRTAVLDQLAGTLGCTHLNDALRALAEVPRLVEQLRTATPAR